MNMTPTYTYKAMITRVVDGDTFDLTVDLGMRVSTLIRVRVRGVNAPELRTAEGKVLKATLVSMLEGKPCTVTTHKDPGDKYGRWLADIHAAETDLGQWLLKNGAVPFMTAV
jgi:micrococcal nuclease